MGTARQGDNDGHQTRLRCQANPTATLAFQSVWGRVMRKFVKAGGIRVTEHDIRGKVAAGVVILAQWGPNLERERNQQMIDFMHQEFQFRRHDDEERK